MQSKRGKSKKRTQKNDAEAIQEENDKRARLDTMSEVVVC